MSILLKRKTIKTTEKINNKRKARSFFSQKMAARLFQLMQKNRISGTPTNNVNNSNQQKQKHHRVTVSNRLILVGGVFLCYPFSHEMSWMRS